MSVVNRNGTYGWYYGSLPDTSEPLTTEQMTTNAIYIYDSLLANGWSSTAICAIIANMEHEGGLNPGRWQSDNVGSLSSGFGLVQWTPASKYIDWCSAQNLSDYTTMDNNIARILYEVENGLQWLATDNYDFSFKEFTTSTKDVRYLARAFLLNYERPADQSIANQNRRADTADKWRALLYNNGGGGGSVVTRKRDGFNFVLFNRRRRMKQW